MLVSGGTCYLLTTWTCVLTASSVHKERIERLWRDVHRCVVSVFADTFRNLESDGVLDPLNEVNLLLSSHIFTTHQQKCVRV